MRRALVFGLVVIFVLAIALPGLVILHGRDIEGASDDDLKVARLSIPAEDNAFTHLDRATRALAWPKDEGEHEDRVEQILAARAWHGDWVDDVLRANVKSLDHVRRTLERVVFQPPAFRTPDDEMEGLTEWPRLGKLLALEAWSHAHRGESLASLQSSLAVVRLGHQVQNAHSGMLLHAMIGDALQEIGLTAMRNTLPLLEIEPEEARKVIAALESLRFDPESWARMWAAEYQLMKHTLLRAGEEFGASSNDTAGERNPLSGLRPGSYVFHPNRTLAMYGDVIRSFQRDANQPCHQLTPPALPDARTAWHKLGLLLLPNGAGRVLVAFAAPNFHRYQLKRCVGTTHISATQTMLALRVYEMEHGALPPSLDPLVPRYLPRLPMDAFAGARLRYRPEERMLYSIGSDFEDHGGRLAIGEDTMAEPSYQLTF